MNTDLATERSRHPRGAVPHSSRGGGRWRSLARLRARVTVAVSIGALVMLPATAANAEVRDSGDSDVSVSVPAEQTPASTPPPSETSTPDETPAPDPGDQPADAPAEDTPGTAGDAATPVAGSGPAPVITSDQPSGDQPAAACTPTEPAMPTAPAKDAEEANVDRDLYLAGQTVRVTASGYGAGEQVQAVLFGEPKLIGTFTADDQGSVSAEFTVDEATTAGSHVLQLTGWCQRISAATVVVGKESQIAAGFEMPGWLWWPLGLIVIAVLVWVLWRVSRQLRGSGTEAA